MSENTAFKEHLNMELAERWAERITAVYPTAVYPPFNTPAFLAQIAAELENLELKQRSALIATALRDHLPAEFNQAIAILQDCFPDELSHVDGEFSFSFDMMPIAHFVELYGLDDFEVSMAAMKAITKRFSAEFAIRPFLTRYPQQTLAILHEWAQDKNVHVRRLVSEGTRPRLPWASRLYQFIEDPSPVLPLLTQLKDDESQYVRRSVANHLNDIAKDHPDVVIATLRDWQQNSGEHLDWITRHALRTLVKDGHPDALALLGFGKIELSVIALRVEPEQMQMGESVTITVTLQSETAVPQPLVIDYAIHFVKANGRTSPKVFKWTQKELNGRQTLTLSKKHTIKPITTRRYYSGEHVVAVQVNGRVLATTSFHLMA
ncbi:MAG: DNA alkylation repair protein [Ardenticatenaceae bacterium]|nr:DNA alkylation repair protein [Ardenticatenaceae bacterium]